MKSSIDLSYFIGQSVVEVNSESSEPFGMEFDHGWLRVECSWRIRSVDGYVQIGDGDMGHEGYSNQAVHDILIGKRITNISICKPIADLKIEFDGSLYLDIFHVSALFEGWELSGEGQIRFWTDPGGLLDCFGDNPLFQNKSK